MSIAWRDWFHLALAVMWAIGAGTFVASALGWIGPPSTAMLIGGAMGCLALAWLYIKDVGK